MFEARTEARTEAKIEQKKVSFPMSVTLTKSLVLAVLATWLSYSSAKVDPEPGNGGASTSSQGQESISDAQKREQKILALLSGYEWHLDEAAFRSLPEDCWQDLLRISTDQRFMKVIRSRAAIALTLFPNDTVWSRMKDRVGDSNAGSDRTVVMNGKVTRRRAVEQMCRTFAEDRAGAVEEQMIPLLEASDPHLRIKAVQCLRNVMGESGEKALMQYQNNLQDSSGERNWERKAVGLETDLTE